jgi:hypothetical protein
MLNRIGSERRSRGVKKRKTAAAKKFPWKPVLAAYVLLVLLYVLLAVFRHAR